MRCDAPDHAQWLESMIEEIKELEQMGCWKIVKLTSLSPGPGAKLINSCGVWKLKVWDSLYECHLARLVAMGYQREKGCDYFESFWPTCSHSTICLVLVLAVHGRHSLDCDTVCNFKVLFKWSCSGRVWWWLSIWKDWLVLILERLTACTCWSASTASYKHLTSQYCGYRWYSVTKFTKRLVWSNFRLISACLSAMSLKSLDNNSLPTVTSLLTANFSTWMWCLINVRLQVVLSSGGCYDPRWSYWFMWTTTVYSMTAKNWCEGFRKRSSRIGGLTCNVNDL